MSHPDYSGNTVTAVNRSCLKKRSVNQLSQVLPPSKVKQEITDYEWVIMWERFKQDADQVLGDLRLMVSFRMDQQFETQDWDAISGIVISQPRLEKLIRDSGPEYGWMRNPAPLFQELITAIAESNDLEIRERLEELNLLRQKAEDIWTVD
jgi:hypothetical protein